MPKTEDVNIDDLSSLSILARRKVDPKQQFTSDVLKAETTSGYGIMAKALAGAMLGQQANQEMEQIRQAQAVQIQHTQEVINLYAEDEKKGWSNGYTKRRLRDLALKGNPIAEEQLKNKFADVNENDPVDQFKDYIEMTGKYLSKEDREKDPTYMHLKTNYQKAVSGQFGGVRPDAKTQGSPSVGARQDTNKDVNGFEDVARLAQGQDELSDVTAPEIDPYTGKLTSKGEKQEIKNKAVLAKKTRESKPPTQAQESTALYASRIKQSNRVFDSIESFINKQGPKEFLEAGLPDFANFMKSEDMQSYQQAQRNFLNAVLRRESGAVISPSEFKEGRQQYFPQPGDKPKAIAQKKANRDLVMKNFIKGAGSAYTPYEESEGETSPPRTTDFSKLWS